MLNNYEKLEVWKRSCQLSVEIYTVSRNFNDYSFRDQIRRASISVPSNIAEGSERGSPKDFSRFLKIAKGSLAELRTQLLIHRKISLTLNEPQFKNIDGILKETQELSSMIASLIRTLDCK